MLALIAALRAELTCRTELYNYHDIDCVTGDKRDKDDLDYLPYKVLGRFVHAEQYGSIKPSLQGD